MNILPIKPVKSGSKWFPYVQGALGLATIGYAWAMFEPFSFATQAVPWLIFGARTAVLGGTTWFLLQKPHPITQTWQDVATGIYITGNPGSGKTALAYLMARRFFDKGWGWVWLSIKPSLRRDASDQPRLPEFLPPSAADAIDVFAPYGDHPRGLQFLRTYTGTATEREMLADQTAELFMRLHAHMSNLMRDAIRMGALALLNWAAVRKVEVTLWELYKYFQSEAFMDDVLVYATGPLRDAFNPREIRATTLQAVRGQLRRMVTTDNVLVALSQRDGIDLWDVIQRGGHLVCDTPDGVVGDGVASFLCQVISSRLQMLSARRPSGSKPFGVFCDEFQEYTNKTFAKAIAKGREYGLVWVLIHQSHEGQSLGVEVEGAVRMCRNMYFFQQTMEDAASASKRLLGRWEPEEFQRLSSRHYKGVKLLHGRSVLVEGRTPDLPAPDFVTAAAIVDRNAQGPDRASILREITARKVVGLDDGEEIGEQDDQAGAPDD